MRQLRQLPYVLGLHLRAVLQRINILPWIGEHCVTRNFAMLIIQLLGAFSVLYGISYWSIPCALIVGGIGAIAAMELQGERTKEAEDTPEQEQRIRAQVDAALAHGRNPFIGSPDQPSAPMTSKWLTYVALVRRSGDSK